MRKCIAVGALALGLLAACSDDDTEQTRPAANEPATGEATSTTQLPATTPVPGSPAALDGTTFTTTTLTVDGQPTPGAGDSTFTVSFADGKVHADFGCNTGTGTYRIDGDTLVVEQLATTRKGCSGALADQDALMSALLTGSPTVQLAGDELTLTGSTVVFTGTKA